MGPGSRAMLRGLGSPFLIVFSLSSVNDVTYASRLLSIHQHFIMQLTATGRRRHHRKGAGAAGGAHTRQRRGEGQRGRR